MPYHSLVPRHTDIFTWFILAPLASSVSKATPHAVRAIFYLPTFQILSALGLLGISKRVKKRNNKTGYLFIVLILILFVIADIYYYLNVYYIHTPVEHASEWQYGYKQVVEQSENIAGIRIRLS